MWPKLFEIPGLGIPINSYGLAIMVGFLLASWIAVKRGKPLGLKSDFILDVGIIGMIFGILGAKINYLLQYPQDVSDPIRKSLWGDMGLNPAGALILGPIPFAFWWWRMRSPKQPVKLVSWKNGVLLVLTLLFALIGTRALHLYQNSEEYNWKVFRSWQSGFVLYGGLIAGIPAAILYVKMRGESTARMADLCAAPIMLALALGRIGCFLNGCCHGKAGSGFPCISFPPGSPAAREQKKGFDQWSDKVHPTQLYEAAAGVLFFFILSRIWKKPRKAQGEVFLMMAMLYAAWRFGVEFIRGDERPAWIGSLSYSQVVSLAVFLVAGVWLFVIRRRTQAPVVPPPVPAEPAKTA